MRVCNALWYVVANFSRALQGAGLEAGWSVMNSPVIQPLITMVTNGDISERVVSNKTCNEAYTICYLMCTQRSPNNHSAALYDRHRSVFTQHLTAHVCPALEQLSGPALVKELSRCWSGHRFMNKWMYKLLRYLVREVVDYAT